jgi:hypothetical protein
MWVMGGEGKFSQSTLYACMKMSTRDSFVQLICTNKNESQVNFNVTDMFIFLILLILLWVYVYVQTCIF